MPGRMGKPGKCAAKCPSVAGTKSTIVTLSPSRVSLSTSGIMKQPLDGSDGELPALIERQRLDEAVAPRQHARLELRGEMPAQRVAHGARALAAQGGGAGGARHYYDADALRSGQRHGACGVHPFVLGEELLELRQREALAFHLHHAVEPSAQEETAVGQQLGRIVHAPVALREVRRIEPKRAVVAERDADAGERGPRIFHGGAIALAPGDATGL